MQEFLPGQRWISDAELQMGLGTILDTDHRTVTVLFPATGEQRVYARQSAPLTRVQFKAGDEAQSQEGWSIIVESVEERGGLLIYGGRRSDDGLLTALPEGELNDLMQLSRPTERLFTGQLDADKWFALRYETLQHANRLGHSPLRGLTGVRTSLLPHQLYIAHEVAGRFAPRVLLADEVGLGKTIEAGLILHQQLLTGQARRVLIVVPESLTHQWLVEMVRRFNLHFSIFDEARCQAVEQSGEQANPFDSAQLVLCSLDFLHNHPPRMQQILQSEWDLLVVDEAHHLEWSPEAPSIEYQLVEALARKIPGVLLLTATPEQLGKASHFARLRLLDADRFHDFETFVAEEKGYEPVANAVEELLENRPLDDAAWQVLMESLGEEDNRELFDALQGAGSEAERATARDELVSHLLDRHGTGRILYRNTRAAVQGFPGRELHPYPLPLPAEYAETLKVFRASGLNEPQLLLCPELLFQADSGQADDAAAHTPWTRIDPRAQWLADTLKALRGKKVLVIAASADTAMDLAEHLRVTTGLHAAVFHEDMSLLERDRAAAYFADPEFGSPVLICSEIGSEGRNFQFAHHLILFDLPLNPDLLEQRIGRLDRIGQSETINIHVPYLEHSGQALMFRWYHEALGAFEKTCPAGHSVFVRVAADLVAALHHPDHDEALLSALIEASYQLHRELDDELHRGRDRLLEVNSCRPGIAQQLQQEAKLDDAFTTLPDYLNKVFDCFGIDSEAHSERSTVIRPGEQMQVSGLPGLSEDGISFTCERDHALANEDLHYLTWDHPLTTAAMETILSGELGNSAITAIKSTRIKPGTLLLEALFVVESTAATALHAERYLPPTTIRVLVGQSGNNLADKLAHEEINAQRQPLEKATAHKVICAYEKELREIIASAENLAEQQAPAIIASAHKQSGELLSREIDRLEALRHVNPNVREEEVEFFREQWRALDLALDSAKARLDAVRVVVAM
ncbi:MAG: RNA polymerase-associated protein RapA [Chromatiales bacterium]|nr:RNA polymerase-associated protein RapA [Chromatiales bacterium]